MCEAMMPHSLLDEKDDIDKKEFNNLKTRKNAFDYCAARMAPLREQCSLLRHCCPSYDRFVNYHSLFFKIYKINIIFESWNHKNENIWYWRYCVDCNYLGWRIRKVRKVGKRLDNSCQSTEIARNRLVCQKLRKYTNNHRK